MWWPLTNPYYCYVVKKVKIIPENENIEKDIW